MQKANQHTRYYSISVRRADTRTEQTTISPRRIIDHITINIDILVMAPSTTTGWVEWAKCPARDVIIEDLRPGGHLYNRDYITAKVIFPWYKQFPAFDKVVFDQFKAWLSDHRKAALIDSFLVEQQQVYFNQDQALYPRQEYNARGQKSFDLDAAKLLLREDIKAREH
jgi:hypothetical protein